MKILLVDDHQMFLDGLNAILIKSDLVHDIECVNNGEDALIKLIENDFDVALIDLRLPILDGVGLLKAANNAGCLVPIIVVTASKAPEDICKVKALGALGFIYKASSSAQILDTISRVLNGELVFPDENTALHNIAHERQSTDWADKHNLTKRQLEVVRLIKQGLSNQEIANKLFVSIATVKSHLSSIFKTLDVKSRTEAVNKAHQFGLD